MAKSNPFVDFIRKYRGRPVMFVQEVLGADPNDFQRLLLEEVCVKRTRRVSVRSGHGVGKFFQVNQPIITPNGQKVIGDIHVGDTVYDMHGLPTRVTGVFPQGEQPLYRMTFSDGTHVLTGLPHLWVARQAWEKHRGKGYRTVTTEEILGSLDRRWQIPMCEPVEFPEAALPVDPYLMGYVLGNGSLCTPGAVKVSCFDEGPYERITAALPEGYRLSGKDGNYQHIATEDYGNMQNAIWAAFMGLGLAHRKSGEKFIPYAYLRASVEQRVALLQGLMDSDGCISPRKGRSKGYRTVFCTSSSDLRDGMISLVQSLGGTAGYSTDTRRGGADIVSRRDSYQVSVNLPHHICPFSVERKAALHRDWLAGGTKREPIRTVVSIEKEGEGEAVCISVDSPTRTYLCNDFIVTHNTTALSWAMIHTLMFNGASKVICTAPAAGTLFDGLMAEVKMWITRMPDYLQELFDITTDHIRVKSMPTEAFISARTSSSDKPEALAGIHAERVLLVVDEASGVPEAVFKAAAGSMSTTNATTVLIGNPTRNSGYFFDTHHVLRDWWKTIHVSCIGNNNVDPDFIESIRRQYGEDSNEYRIRVLGEFPLDDGASYIPRHAVEEAMARHMEVDKATPEVWGLDVARTGNDRVALARRRGPVVYEVQAWGGKDLMGTVGVVKNLWDITPEELRPIAIYVDAIGLGAGVADRLIELGLPGVAVNVSESSGMLGQGMRLRDELWFRGKMAMLEHGLVLPYDEELASELSTPQAEYMSNGLLKVESKKDMKRRGFKSPDKADAVLLTLYSNESPYDTVTTKQHGRNSAYNPRGPLRRNIKAVV